MAEDAAHHGSPHALTFYVVHGNGSTLLGRSWLQYCRSGWKSLRIATVQELPPQLDEIRK